MCYDAGFGGPRHDFKHAGSPGAQHFKDRPCLPDLGLPHRHSPQPASTSRTNIDYSHRRAPPPVPRDPSQDMSHRQMPKSNPPHVTHNNARNQPAITLANSYHGNKNATRGRSRNGDDDEDNVFFISASHV